MDQARLKILFVCTHNQWRSPTAEKLYINDPRLEVRSAGTSSKAVHTVSVRDVAWADLILCMEQKHLDLLQQQFPHLPLTKPLDISNEYRYGDQELIAELQSRTELVLEETNLLPK